MHLITRSALRPLISGVDITPSIIRQEFFFFHFITSLAIYVRLITISHLRQFPSAVCFSLYLFISDLFSSYCTQALFRELTTVRMSHIHLLFCEFWGGCFPPQYCRIFIIPNSFVA